MLVIKRENAMYFFTFDQRDESRNSACVKNSIHFCQLLKDSFFAIFCQMSYTWRFACKMLQKKLQIRRNGFRMQPAIFKILVSPSGRQAKWNQREQ